MLSERTQQLLETPPLVKALSKALASPYDKEKNKDGVINLGVAENGVVSELLLPKLNAPRNVVLADCRYNCGFGTPRFRELLAPYFERTFGCVCSPAQLSVGCGSSALLDALFYSICNPGDVVIVPGPYYTGFDTDLCMRAGVKIVPVDTFPEHGWEVDPAELERVYEAQMSAGNTVKGLLLATPMNPVCSIFGKQQMQMFIDFTERHDLHLICDSLFARSIVNGGVYVSPYHCNIPPKHMEKVHLVYGFAKDFGLGGFHVGVLYSPSAEVNKAVQGLCYFNTVSTDTQNVLSTLFEDEAWLDNYFKSFTDLLDKRCKRVCQFFDQHNIPYVTPTGTLYLFIDLKKYLKGDKPDDEMALFDDLIDKARVYLTPGTLFHSRVAGYFRVCYATPGPEEELMEGLERLVTFLGA